jgi:hypothetical protein
MTHDSWSREDASLALAGDAGSVVFTISLPEGAGFEGTGLFLARTDEPRPGEPRRWRFGLSESTADESGRVHTLREGPFAPGTFVAQVKTWNWRTEFTVHGPGEHHVAIDVPEPREIELVVLDERGGEPLRFHDVRWELTDPIPALEGVCTGVSCMEQHSVRLRLPPAEVWVHVNLRDPKVTGSTTRSIDARTCSDRVVWIYSPSAKLFVELRDGLHVHPIPAELVPRMTLLRSDGRRENSGAWSFASHGPAGWASGISISVGSGTYVLLFPEIPGFRRPESRTVQLSASETTRVRVQLERR